MDITTIKTVVEECNQFFSKNSEFETGGFYRTHKVLQKYIDTPSVYRGNYTIINDTIKVKYAYKHNLESYWLYSAQYIIGNDTTLRRIMWKIDDYDPLHPNNSLPRKRNEIYKFYKYPN